MNGSNSPRILYLGKDESLSSYIKEETARKEYLFESAKNRDEGLSTIIGNVFDIVAVDHDLENEESLNLIEDLAFGGILPPTIYFARKGTESAIARVLELGVENYIVKDRKRKYLELVPALIDNILKRGKPVKEETRSTTKPADIKKEGVSRIEKERESRAEKEKTAILDSLSEMVMFIGKDMNVIWANNAVAEFAKITQRELVGHRCYHVILNNLDPCVGCPIVEAQKTRKSKEAEIISEDGKAWFVRAYPVLDDNGEVEGVVEVKTDITAQKEWEGMLKQASGEWRTTFDSITDMVAIIGKDYKFIKVNMALADSFNMKPKEIVGKKCYELLQGHDAPCQDCPHEEAILNGKGVQIDKYDDRVKAYLHISVSPIFDDGGVVMGSAIIFKDITQQKEAEERLNQYSKHFKQMVGGLTKELKEAPGLLVDKTRNTVLRQFARGVGNELRGPLEIISEKVFSLKKKISKDDEAAQKVLEVITSEIKKTEQIMLLLLYFARPKTPDKKEVEVHKLVQRVLEKYPPSGNVKVITDVSDKLPRVFVDPLQTGQVINNLIINADQSMPNGGELKIIAKSNDNAILLSISDNGPGIPKKDLKKLFDPLSTTRAGKMGIGLAISKNLIESNGGSISVSSKEGEYSTFTIVLPTKE
ncbi:MAG: PAS domain-containing protein [Deltaproteobacteria bacterium]|uniref:histidine kinase n=1 Tax=Candidatus Zymogenus saltonus TaxID=2844893 RepID=A0A9D8KJI0_9DELT|nr:PAS domain-containing protein [Candidatus Zymogenus saltonus]